MREEALLFLPRFGLIHVSFRYRAFWAFYRGTRTAYTDHPRRLLIAPVVKTQQ